jgi:hypothetical protein
VERIIRADDLSANESVVYEAVVAWADTQCQEQNLDSLLYHIRFPIMNKDYFTNYVSASSILAEFEKIDLFRYLHGKDKSVCTTNPRKNVDNTDG